MSDDWKVGDVLVCVSPCKSKASRDAGLRNGGYYTLAGMVDWFTDDPGVLIEGFPSPHITQSWAKRAFRKVKPDKHEECEAEFAILLKLSKQRVKAVLKIGER